MFPARARRPRRSTSMFPAKPAVQTVTTSAPQKCPIATKHSAKAVPKRQPSFPKPNPSRRRRAASASVARMAGRVALSNAAMVRRKRGAAPGKALI